MNRNIILFDDKAAFSLLPLTYAKPVAEICMGILSFKERWQFFTEQSISYLTQDYLREKYVFSEEKSACYINAALVVNEENFKEIEDLAEGESLFDNNKRLIAFIPNEIKAYDLEEIQDIALSLKQKTSLFSNMLLTNPWEIFLWNDKLIKSDFELLTKNRKSEILAKTNTVYGKYPVFLEEGASANASVFNTEKGPIYIGKNAEIMEGCLIRGPFAMGENAVLKMNAKIYGATTLGPGCKVGGEVNNSVFMANSNKAHDGFLGNAVIGEWCNLGADTNNSNLKNTYEEVKLWSYVEEKFVKTGQQFCGLIMGDHSKSSINTMFNTGTVVGFSSNLFGSGFHRNFVPSFSWGGHSKYSAYQFDKAIKTAKLVLQRRSLEFTEVDEKIFVEIFKKSAEYRTF
jgi:UDP-N-acetylglucosamine diphosphorylase/glucosamine-1-phosphate N-acetyltransferase